MPGPGGMEGWPALACGLPEAWKWAQLWPETRLCVSSPAGLTCLSGAVRITRPWGGQREGPPRRGSGRSRVPSPAPVPPRANLPPLSVSPASEPQRARGVPRGTLRSGSSRPFRPSDRGDWREPPGPPAEQPTSAGMGDGRQRAAGPGGRLGRRGRAPAGEPMSARDGRACAVTGRPSPSPTSVHLPFTLLQGG